GAARSEGTTYGGGSTGSGSPSGPTASFDPGSARVTEMESLADPPAPVAAAWMAFAPGVRAATAEKAPEARSTAAARPSPATVAEGSLTVPHPVTEPAVTTEPSGGPAIFTVSPPPSTRTADVAESARNVAVTVAVPAARAVTSPAAETSATPGASM